MIGDYLPADHELSAILEELAQGLQLTTTQDEQARTSYRAVTDWLAADGSEVARFDPDLFPQGSLRLGTTVRPITRSEFDLDVVCLLNLSGETGPQVVYDLIWDRMYENGTYRPIMERLRRCIRLNYARDSKFHLDIVPAVPDSAKGGTYLRIPDRPKPRLISWKTTNPKGYADWFERQIILLEKTARAQIEPLPYPVPATEKAALTKGVQLVKRWRDVRFQEQPDLAPSSIILTTLAAQEYTGEQLCSVAMTRIVEGLSAFAESGQRELRNPANPEEVISEKWLADSHAYDAFVQAAGELRDAWRDIGFAAQSPESGHGNITAKLRSLFGEPVTEAVKAASERINRARRDGKVFVERKSGGIITEGTSTAAASTLIKVRKQTFYGDEISS
ncbi:MAG: SMODS domain-containing nucleotidyltransferase [Isosphaeraceae bacterium]